MSSFDNEIYRGPPEAGPTLEHDIRSYGSDVYILKAEKNTLAQDVPPTEEPIRQDAKPAQKKESKIAKAMKLLASCTAAAAVAATLAVAPHALPEVDAVWPWFGPVHDQVGSMAFDAISQNSDVCQVSIGGKFFRLEALQEGIHLQWHETYDPSEDGSHGGFYVCMENIPENWTLILDFNVNPIQKTEDSEGLCQITSTTGDTLYVRGFFISGDEPSTQQTMDQLDSYIRITEPTADGWGKVLIGKTMYSEINEQWNGIQSINPWQEESDPWDFYSICDTGIANYDLDDLVCQHRINGIDWRFYTSLEKGAFTLWAVPHQENIAFAVDITHILYRSGFDPATLEEMYGTDQLDMVASELGISLRSELLRFIDFSVIQSGLCNYYLLDQPSQAIVVGALPQWPRIAGWYATNIAFRDWPDYPIQTASLNSHSCQVSVGDAQYTVEALQENLYVSWDNSHWETYYDGYGGMGEASDYIGMPFDDRVLVRGFSLWVHNPLEAWQVRLHFSLYPPHTGDGETPSCHGSIQTDSGQTLYVIDYGMDRVWMTDEESARILEMINNLSSYLRIHDGANGDWGMVQLGDELISRVTPTWTGTGTVKHAEYFSYENATDLNWHIGVICYTNSIDMAYYRHLRSQEINGIQWDFYMRNYFLEPTFLDPTIAMDYYLLMIPSHGDMALAADTESILASMSREVWGLSVNNPELLDNLLPDMIDRIIEDGLIHIYPVGTGENSQPENPNADKYFHAAEFSMGDRSFRMDSMQDNISIRHFYTGPEESEEFDLWFARDNTHVKLVVSTYPEGKEFYEYAYPGFEAVYYALYSWPDHPLSSDELDTLAYDIPSLVYLTELTASQPDVPETAPAFTEEYFTSLAFSYADRTFQIDALRNDVSFRQIWQGEDNVQFDFRADNENIRVKLIVGGPNGAEYYPYVFPNGMEVYVAAFNNWGDPWLLSNDALHNLMLNISSYVKITENTEPVLPEPYPEMAEYIQYGISYDVGQNHTDFARSNRVCQFITDRGNYRLRSLVPEVFVFTEDYYYDVKEDTSNSRISIRHHEEGWRLEAWVFNDPVESIYQGFPMTAEDGSQLWFYISSYPESYDDNQLQALMGRIPELVTLSTARDADWGKIRIGETLISHNNQYWNGLAYTAGSFDYWAFEKILDSHALSGYDLRHAGQRVVNGITWDFYTMGSPSGYPDSNGKDYYFTNVYVVCGQEDIWLQTSLSYGLSPSNSQFASQAEYEADLDWEMGFAIDTIVRTGLSNYYLYP